MKALSSSLLVLAGLLSCTAVHADTDADEPAFVVEGAESAGRDLAQISLDPIEDSDQSMTTIRRKRPRRLNSSFLHLVPVAGWVNTNWKGISSTPSSYLNSGSGGTTSAKDGYAAGVDVLVGSGQFQFESGLRYALRSVVYSGNLKDQDGRQMSYTGRITENVSYIELPLLARFSFPEPSSSAHVFIHAGAKSGFVVGRESNIDNVTYAYQTGYFYPAFFQPSQASATGTLGNLNAVDFRGLAGLGGAVKITRDIGLSIVGDYERSITKINSSGPDNIVIEGFSAFAGVTFGL